MNDNASRVLVLSEARPGMTLAADLSDAQGHVLLKSGTVLDEARIELLRRRGFAEFAVIGAEAGPEAAPEHGLERLFRRCRPEDVWFRTLIETYRRESGQ